MDVNLEIDISIIIPAMNEEERLPPFLLTIIEYCRQSDKIHEIIVVDDGSSDQTAETAARFNSAFPRIKVISLEKNMGKGFAVKRGLSVANGEIVLFLDADGSTQPQEIGRNLHFFDEGYDVVIGSRALRGHEHRVKTKFYRRWIGSVFNMLVHNLLFKDIQDSQCGFKMFRRETIKPIFSQMTIHRFGFDLEILYIASQLEFKIKEVPVDWTIVEGSKVNLVTDSFQMFCNILEIRNKEVRPLSSFTSEQDTSLESIEEITIHQKSPAPESKTV